MPDYNCVISILPTHEDMSVYGKNVLVELTDSNPHAVIGTATGGTLKRVYRKLGASGVDASGVTLSQFDSYIPIRGAVRDEDNDYELFVIGNIAEQFPPDKRPALSNIHVLNGNVAFQDEVEAELTAREGEYTRFGSEIALNLRDDSGALGRIYAEIMGHEEFHRYHPRDLQLLGISPGDCPHSAFNDFWTSPEARTHLVELHESTRTANSRFVGGDLDRVSTFALSEGPANIQEARKLFLLASGPEKTGAIASTFLVEPTYENRRGASARNIFMHDNSLVALEMEAAARILDPESQDTIIMNFESVGRSVLIESYI